MKDLALQIFDQGKRLENLASRINRAQAKTREAHDRIFYTLQDAFIFRQTQNSVRNLVFNVPQSDDIEVARLSIYPFIRRVAVGDLPVGATPDLTFRPTLWSFQLVPNDLVRYGVDALIELTTALPDGKTRRYQNAAFYAAQTFSGYTSPIRTSDAQAFDRTESPSALVFDPCWHLPRGSTVTARVTPLFSGERDPAFTDGLINEYQIRGVLEGYKRAR